MSTTIPKRRVLALRRTKPEAEASARAWTLSGMRDVQVELGGPGTSDLRPYAVTAAPVESKAAR